MYIELWCIITAFQIQYINKTSWYEAINNFFSNYIFEQNVIQNQRCILLLFEFPRILCFTFSSLFSVFLLSIFFFSSMFSALLPITEKTMILSKIPLKYDDNTRSLESSINWKEKHWF